MDDLDQASDFLKLLKILKISVGPLDEVVEFVIDETIGIIIDESIEDANNSGDYSKENLLRHIKFFRDSISGDFIEVLKDIRDIDNNPPHPPSPTPVLVLATNYNHSDEIAY